MAETMRRNLVNDASDVSDGSMTDNRSRHDLEWTLKVIGGIVAPTTALTALMYYFGFLHAYWFLQAFGVEVTVMGFGTEDYLMRSADGLFVPITTIAALVLAWFWVGQPLVRRLSKHQRAAVRRLGSVVGIVTGLLLLAIAAVGLMAPQVLLPLIALPGLSMAGSVVILAATIGELSARGIAGVLQWAAAFVLIVVGLFWAAADYSAAVGTQRARDVIRALPTWPDVVLYTHHDLKVAGPGVTTTRCSEESEYRYRFDGLKLILHSDDKYFFLSSGWIPSNGHAIIVPNKSGLRLDFARTGVVSPSPC